eukprot:scaffold157558_cov35-Tisochrysis_lutea.AAC.5
MTGTPALSPSTSVRAVAMANVSTPLGITSTRSIVLATARATDRGRVLAWKGDLTRMCETFERRLGVSSVGIGTSCKSKMTCEYTTCKCRGIGYQDTHLASAYRELKQFRRSPNDERVEDVVGIEERNVHKADSVPQKFMSQEGQGLSIGRQYTLGAQVFRDRHRSRAGASRRRWLREAEIDRHHRRIPTGYNAAWEGASVRISVGRRRMSASCTSVTAAAFSIVVTTTTTDPFPT